MHIYYLPANRERLNRATKRIYSEKELRQIADKDINRARDLARQSAQNPEQLQKWWNEFLDA